MNNPCYSGTICTALKNLSDNWVFASPMHLF
jgi:hypothetical protein